VRGERGGHAVVDEVAPPHAARRERAQLRTAPEQVAQRLADPLVVVHVHAERPEQRAPPRDGDVRARDDVPLVAVELAPVELALVASRPFAEDERLSRPARVAEDRPARHPQLEKVLLLAVVGDHAHEPAVAQHTRAQRSQQLAEMVDHSSLGGPNAAGKVAEGVPVARAQVVGEA